ncbi:MAG: hypothetical protein KJ573_03915, partial [Proteobacteria bacterium]|nr:hypothetical protein [Pseudomonadota bacterium]
RRINQVVEELSVVEGGKMNVRDDHERCGRVRGPVGRTVAACCSQSKSYGYEEKENMARSLFAQSHMHLIRDMVESCV